MPEWIQKISELQKQSKSFVIATIIEMKGSGPRGLGTKIIIEKDGSFHGTIGGGILEKNVLEDSKICFQNNKCFKKSYSLKEDSGSRCGGEAEVFFEPHLSKTKLYIFGAGHVGQALCKAMIETQFSINLIDDRTEWINNSQVPASIIRHCSSWEKFCETAEWSSKDTFVVIATPQHEKDQDVLEEVLKKNTFYVGMIGSKRKWEETKNNLLKKGVDKNLLDTVYCPIGLKIGGKAPKEIAISIAAQIIQKHYENN